MPAFTALEIAKTMLFKLFSPISPECRPALLSAAKSGGYHYPFHAFIFAVVQERVINHAHVPINFSVCGEYEFIKIIQIKNMRLTRTHHGYTLISDEGTPLANGPTTLAKDVVGTKAALDSFMHRLLAVPSNKIKAALEAEKAGKRTSAKRSASRVSVSSPKRAI